MKKILALLCLITMINDIYNTDCTEISKSRRNLRILEDWTDDDCKDGETGDENKQCFVNQSNDGCEAKACEDFDNGSCSRFVPVLSTKICKPKGDNCEITERSCEEMDKSSCADLETDLTQCILNTQTDKCEPKDKTCEEMNIEKCNIFITKEKK